jgi:orotate phosphoribosyltransferase
MPMKFVFGITVVVALFLNSCAALMDGKFVTKDGKESPYKKQRNLYEMPKDPTSDR